jgi:hypothetical protein
MGMDVAKVSRMTNTLRVAVVAFVCLGWASVASAQVPADLQYGVRAGVSGGPSQFVLGGHLETKPFLPHLTFRPNFEAGFGDNASVYALNFEFAYRINIDKKPWWVYVGGGPAAVWIHADNADTDFGGGFNFLVGVQHRKGIFAEIKGGAGHSPDVKFMVGWAFK